MEARAKIFGHPIHQMLIPIPFGLFTTAAVLDIITAFVHAPGLNVVSFWNLSIGIVTGLLAAVFGLIDWTGIPRGTRAKRVGAAHGIGNVVVVALFAGAVVMRVDQQFFAVPALALGLEVGALLIAIVTGWLGGELVDRLGVGVHPEADPNGPRGGRIYPRPHVVEREVVVSTSSRGATPPYGTPSTT